MIPPLGLSGVSMQQHGLAILAGWRGCNRKDTHVFCGSMHSCSTPKEPMVLLNANAKGEDR